MKVISYFKGIPAKNKNQEKVDILKKFIQGVTASGDIGIVHDGYNVVDCDVAVIQGWQHESGKNLPHLILRQKIIDTQLQQKKFVCVADSNLFLYANSTNEPHHYLRYSFNGIFPNTGIYFDKNIDPKRWQQISKDLNINLEQPKTSGKNIVICLQRNGGWSMQGVSVVAWLGEIIRQIRQYSDRPIVIRPHPGDKQAELTYIPQLVRNYQRDKTVTISKANTPLQENLKNAWAVVNHNSSSIVGPVIMGYHAFITDANRSQCAEVAHHNFSKLETPQIFDRQRWLERISMFHWKFTELENGAAWQHIRSYVNF